MTNKLVTSSPRAAAKPSIGTSQTAKPAAASVEVIDMSQDDNDSPPRSVTATPTSALQRLQQGAAPQAHVPLSQLSARSAFEANPEPSPPDSEKVDSDTPNADGQALKQKLVAGQNVQQVSANQHIAKSKKSAKTRV